MMQPWNEVSVTRWQQLSADTGRCCVPSLAVATISFQLGDLGCVESLKKRRISKLDETEKLPPSLMG